MSGVQVIEVNELGRRALLVDLADSQVLLLNAELPHAERVEILSWAMGEVEA